MNNFFNFLHNDLVETWYINKTPLEWNELSLAKINLNIHLFSRKNRRREGLYNR